DAEDAGADRRQRSGEWAARAGAIQPGRPISQTAEHGPVSARRDAGGAEEVVGGGGGEIGDRSQGTGVRGRNLEIEQILGVFSDGRDEGRGVSEGANRLGRGAGRR